eukprot:g968.t1
MKKVELLREKAEEKRQKRLTATFMKCKPDSFRATLSSIDTYYSPLPTLHATPTRDIIHKPSSLVKSKKIKKQISKELEEEENNFVSSFSVFAPSKEQKEASLQSRLQREKLANSQWELLTTFNSSQYQQENEDRRKRDKLIKEEQKKVLDSQIQLIQEKKQQEELEIQEERKRLDCAISREEERVKTEAELKRAAARNNKTELLANYSEYIKKLEQERMTTLETERSELERIQKQMNAEIEAEEERKRNRAAEIARQRQENEAVIRQKKDQERQIAAEDARLVEETLKTLAKQDQERAEKLEEFHAKIEAKAKSAGKSVVEEANKRRRQEEERLAKFQADYDARVKKEALEAEERQKRRQDETLRCLDLQLKEKQQTLEKEQQFAKIYAQEVPLVSC